MAAGTAALRQGLPAAMRRAVDEFAHHQASVAGRSPHTVRAYVADVVALLDHAVRMGRVEPGQLDLVVLRSWLAACAPRERPGPRWPAGRPLPALSASGRTGAGSPPTSPPAWRARGWCGALPSVLRVDQAATLLDGAGGDDSPKALRDRAVLELLYATGMRVSELCGLDVDDVDRARRVVRVLGKGDQGAGGAVRACRPGGA